MTGHELLHRISIASSSGLFSTLYGNTGITEAQARYHTLLEATLRDFPETEGNIHVFTAPGRTELGGNHTDHNHGKVLAASIQLDAVAFVSPRKDKKVIYRSTGYPDVLVDLSDLSPRSEERGTTEALVRGIAAEFTQRGVAIQGFVANADSTVLPGSGLSSSAAVEVLIGVIFDGLYGEGKRSAVEIAQIGQKAENVYFGKPCGLMDQIACASGGAVAIDFQDPAQPAVRQVPFDLSSAGYTLCVVDTGGSHADLTADYAAVPVEMKSIATLLGKSVLREVSKEAILAQAPEIRRKCGDRALLRALHFFAENDRVDAMLTNLERFHQARTQQEQQSALYDYFQFVEASANSSWELLQNVFTTQKPEEQGVSLALALTRDFFSQIGQKGTCRVHGGGFAGTIQAYIPSRYFLEYKDYMGKIFGEKSVRELQIRSIGAVELHFA